MGPIPITGLNVKRLPVQSSQISYAAPSPRKTGSHSSFDSVFSIKAENGLAAIGSSKSVIIQLSRCFETRRMAMNISSDETISASVDILNSLERKLKTLQRSNAILESTRTIWTAECKPVK